MERYLNYRTTVTVMLAADYEMRDMVKGVQYIFDIARYKDKEEFTGAVREFIAEERGIKAEGIVYLHDDLPPILGRLFVSTYEIASELWEIMDLSMHDSDIFINYLSVFNTYRAESIAQGVEWAKESFEGCYDSLGELAKKQELSTGSLDRVSSDVIAAIDWEKVGETLRTDYAERNGYYFYLHS